MIEYYKKINGSDEIEKVEKFEKNCWVKVTDPDEKEILFLIEKFNLNKESLMDGLDIHENPRFQIENKKTYLYLTAPTEKIVHEHDSSFLIIYFERQLITLSKYNLEIFDKVVNGKFKTTSFSISRNLIKILFNLSRIFEESVQKIRKEVRTNRAELSKLKNKDIEKLINYEDKLNDYLSSFKTTISTYSKILREKSLDFIKKDEEIIKNLIIDLNETLALCEQTLRNISNMRNYYSTKLSNDLNKTVTVLTMVTIFISIPTLIASIYGMNVDLPFQSSPHIFWSLMLLILAIIGIFWVILKKFKVIH